MPECSQALYLELVSDGRSQYHWAIANIGFAQFCVVVAAGAFIYGYVVAGLLVLVVSVALVVNADLHRKRGDVIAGEAKQDD